MNATRLANNSMPRFEGEEMTGYDPFDYVLTGAFRDDGVRPRAKGVRRADRNVNAT
jgi:hypothetical protein